MISQFRVVSVVLIIVTYLVILPEYRNLYKYLYNVIIYG